MTRRISVVAYYKTRQKTKAEISISECEKVFKRKEHILARKYLTRIPNPADIRIMYRPDWDTHFVNPRQITFLHLAAEHGWKDVCGDLIRLYKCQPDCTDDQQVYTPLHYAIGGQQKEVVKLLIEVYHCNPKFESAVSPLQLASSVGDIGIIDYLLSECHCDPNSYDHIYNTPLHHAVFRGQLEVVLSLLASNKIHSLQYNIYGDTPLHWACRYGYYEIVVALMSHIDVEPTLCRNNIGDTPLHDATRNGYFDIVKKILQIEHLRINSPNTLGNTALHEACSQGHTDIINLILTYRKVDPTCKNTVGNTPLHLACSRGHLSTVSLLLNSGYVNPRSYNYAKKTPLDVAKPVIQTKVKELFDSFDKQVSCVF